MNVCIQMGRLTAEPEIRTAANNAAMTIATFRMAIDRRFKREGQPDADFFNYKCFGKQAEFVEKYLHKGTKVVVTGTPQNDNFEGRDGNMVYRNVIIVENVEFAESKAASERGQAGGGAAGGAARTGGAGGGSNRGASRQAGNASRGHSSNFADPGGIDDIGADIDEDLPFN